ncbi:MAG: putative lipoprotein YmbA [Porticoccus sp.]|jgi:uncharacterized lipoprotein YmbA
MIKIFSRNIFSRYIAPLALTLALAGCASTGVSNNYYLLNASQSADEQQQSSIDNSKQLLVEPVVLADFLNQKFLVMQKGNQLYVSETHQWAQPLAGSITQAIAEDLRADLSDWRVSKSRLNPGDRSAYSLLVAIDQFHPNDESLVSLKGSFQIRNGKELVLEDHFFISEALKQDGFSQSVSQLSDLLSQLAKKISTQLGAIEG